MPISLSTVISALDTPRSLLPIFLKDSIDNTGRVVMASKEGGKHEARERFIEENATSLFWIGGIPAFRWIANKIAKKRGKIDPDIHFKRINTNGIQGYFADETVVNGKNKFSPEDLDGIVLENSKLNKIKEDLVKNGFKQNFAEQKGKKSILNYLFGNINAKGKYGKYHVGISAAAVLFNLFMLTFAVPKLNQALSRKIISKEVKDQNKNDIQNKEPIPKKPSFKGSKELFDLKNLFNFTRLAETTQLNPASSMLLLDYGISGSRVTIVPRNNNERVEYAVKEGSVIFFFYYAADWIKKGFEVLTKKILKTPIDLDYKIITDKGFAKILKEKPDKETLLKFAELAENDEKEELKVIKFIDQQLEKVSLSKDKKDVFSNFTLKMAQKSGLIDVEKDEELGRWIRHSKKYIETDKLTKLNKHLREFIDNAAKNGKDIQKAILKTKAVKALCVFGNIAICSVSLGILLPKVQYLIREHRTKTKQAPGVKHYQEMAKENKI